MHEELLIKTGLSLREINVYTTLLSHGELMASELSKKTNLVRTNVYDVLNTLIKKGLVSHVIRGGRKYFNAADPEKLVDYVNYQKEQLEETREELAKALPELKPKKQKGAQRPNIEIYEGKEGLKTILMMSIRESLRTGKEILGISVQQQKCRALAGPYHIRWYTDRAKHKIKSRYLMSAEEKIIPVEYTKFKILPRGAKNPNEIFIFGDITTQFLFVGDSFSAIVIDNEQITNRYRDYFDFLWKMVK